jgi:hypothetical protein
LLDVDTFPTSLSQLNTITGVMKGVAFVDSESSLVCLSVYTTTILPECDERRLLTPSFLSAVDKGLRSSIGKGSTTEKKDERSGKRFDVS